MVADFRRPLESMIHLDGFEETKLRDKELTQKEKYFLLQLLHLDCEHMLRHVADQAGLFLC